MDIVIHTVHSYKSQISDADFPNDVLYNQAYPTRLTVAVSCQDQQQYIRRIHLHYSNGTTYPNYLSGALSDDIIYEFRIDNDDYLVKMDIYYDHLIAGLEVYTANGVYKLFGQTTSHIERIFFHDESQRVYPIHAIYMGHETSHVDYHHDVSPRNHISPISPRVGNQQHMAKIPSLAVCFRNLIPSVNPFTDDIYLLDVRRIRQVIHHNHRLQPSVFRDPRRLAQLHPTVTIDSLCVSAYGARLSSSDPRIIPAETLTYLKGMRVFPTMLSIHFARDDNHSHTHGFVRPPPSGVLPICGVSMHFNTPLELYTLDAMPAHSLSFLPPAKLSSSSSSSFLLPPSKPRIVISPDTAIPRDAGMLAAVSLVQEIQDLCPSYTLKVVSPHGVVDESASHITTTPLSLGCIHSAGGGTHISGLASLIQLPILDSIRAIEVYFYPYTQHSLSDVRSHSTNIVVGLRIHYSTATSSPLIGHECGICKITYVADHLFLSTIIPSFDAITGFIDDFIFIFQPKHHLPATFPQLPMANPSHSKSIGKSSKPRRNTPHTSYAVAIPLRGACLLTPCIEFGRRTAMPGLARTSHSSQFFPSQQAMQDYVMLHEPFELKKHRCILYHIAQRRFYQLKSYTPQLAAMQRTLHAGTTNDVNGTHTYHHYGEPLCPSSSSPNTNTNPYRQHAQHAVLPRSSDMQPPANNSGPRPLSANFPQQPPQASAGVGIGISQTESYGESYGDDNFYSDEHLIIDNDQQAYHHSDYREHRHGPHGGAIYSAGPRDCRYSHDDADAEANACSEVDTPHMLDDCHGSAQPPPQQYDISTPMQLHDPHAVAYESSHGASLGAPTPTPVPPVMLTPDDVRLEQLSLHALPQLISSFVTQMFHQLVVPAVSQYSFLRPPYPHYLSAAARGPCGIAFSYDPLNTNIQYIALIFDDAPPQYFGPVGMCPYQVASSHQACTVDPRSTHHHHHQQQQQHDLDQQFGDQKPRVMHLLRARLMDWFTEYYCSFYNASILTSFQSHPFSYILSHPITTTDMLSMLDEANSERTSVSREQTQEPGLHLAALSAAAEPPTVPSLALAVVDGATPTPTPAIPATSSSSGPALETPPIGLPSSKPYKHRFYSIPHGYVITQCTMYYHRPLHSAQSPQPSHPTSPLVSSMQPSKTPSNLPSPPSTPSGMASGQTSSPMTICGVIFHLQLYNDDAASTHGQSRHAGSAKQLNPLGKGGETPTIFSIGLTDTPWKVTIPPVPNPKSYVISGEAIASQHHLAHIDWVFTDPDAIIRCKNTDLFQCYQPRNIVHYFYKTYDHLLRRQLFRLRKPLGCSLFSPQSYNSTIRQTQALSLIPTVWEQTSAKNLVYGPLQFSLSQQILCYPNMLDQILSILQSFSDHLVHQHQRIYHMGSAEAASLSLYVDSLGQTYRFVQHDIGLITELVSSLAMFIGLPKTSAATGKHTGSRPSNGRNHRASSSLPTAVTPSQQQPLKSFHQLGYSDLQQYQQYTPASSSTALTSPPVHVHHRTSFSHSLSQEGKQSLTPLTHSPAQQLQSKLQSTSPPHMNEHALQAVPSSRGSRFQMDLPKRVIAGFGTNHTLDLSDLGGDSDAIPANGSTSTNQSTTPRSPLNSLVTLGRPNLKNLQALASAKADTQWQPLTLTTAMLGVDYTPLMHMSMSDVTDDVEASLGHLEGWEPNSDTLFFLIILYATTVSTLQAACHCSHCLRSIARPPSGHVGMNPTTTTTTGSHSSHPSHWNNSHSQSMKQLPSRGCSAPPSQPRLTGGAGSLVKTDGDEYVLPRNTSYPSATREGVGSDSNPMTTVMNTPASSSHHINMGATTSDVLFPCSDYHSLYDPQTTSGASAASASASNILFPNRRAPPTPMPPDARRHHAHEHGNKSGEDLHSAGRDTDVFMTPHLQSITRDSHGGAKQPSDLSLQNSLSLRSAPSDGGDSLQIEMAPLHEPSGPKRLLAPSAQSACDASPHPYGSGASSIALGRPQVHISSSSSSQLRSKPPMSMSPPESPQLSSLCFKTTPDDPLFIKALRVMLQVEYSVLYTMYEILTYHPTLVNLPYLQCCDLLQGRQSLTRAANGGDHDVETHPLHSHPHNTPIAHSHPLRTSSDDQARAARQSNSPLPKAQRRHDHRSSSHIPSVRSPKNFFTIGQIYNPRLMLEHFYAFPQLFVLFRYFIMTRYSGPPNQLHGVGWMHRSRQRHSPIPPRVQTALSAGGYTSNLFRQFNKQWPFVFEAQLLQHAITAEAFEFSLVLKLVTDIFSKCEPYLQPTGAQVADPHQAPPREKMSDFHASNSLNGAHVKPFPTPVSVSHRDPESRHLPATAGDLSHSDVGGGDDSDSCFPRLPGSSSDLREVAASACLPGTAAPQGEPRVGHDSAAHEMRLPTDDVLPSEVGTPVANSSMDRATQQPKRDHHHHHHHTHHSTKQQGGSIRSLRLIDPSPRLHSLYPPSQSSGLSGDLYPLLSTGYNGIPSAATMPTTPNAGQPPTPIPSAQLHLMSSWEQVEFTITHLSGRYRLAVLFIIHAKVFHPAIIMPSQRPLAAMRGRGSRPQHAHGSLKPVSLLAAHRSISPSMSGLSTPTQSHLLLSPGPLEQELSAHYLPLRSPSSFLHDLQQQPMAYNPWTSHFPTYNLDKFHKDVHPFSSHSS